MAITCCVVLSQNKRLILMSLVCCYTACMKKKPRFSLRPDFIVDTVQSIDFEMLAQHGIKACLIDLDGTVVKRGTYDVSETIKVTLKRASQVMDIYIATNRPKSRDLKNLKNDIYAKGVIHPKFIYGKPTKRYFTTGLLQIGVPPEQAVMIGDRRIQDIFGANRAGVYSLLVRKLNVK